MLSLLSTRGKTVCAAVLPPLAKPVPALTDADGDGGTGDDDDDDDVKEVTANDAVIALKISLVVVVVLVGVELGGAAVSCSSLTSSSTVTRVPIDVTWWRLSYGIKRVDDGWINIMQRMRLTGCDTGAAQWRSDNPSGRQSESQSGERRKNGGKKEREGGGEQGKGEGRERGWEQGKGGARELPGGP